jgi:ATP-binding cassette subfamily F protein 3
MVLRGANFLLLDEPTNNLDIPSIEVLEEALEEFNGTILTISHDRYFLDRICERIIEIDDGWLREYQGGFSAYDRQRGKGKVLQDQGLPTQDASASGKQRGEKHQQSQPREQATARSQRRR